MTVKDIDMSGLEHYTIKTKDGLMLRKPENRPGFPALTNLVSTNGHRYATTSLTWETGHVLMDPAVAKKQVVYDFIKFVGLD